MSENNNVFIKGEYIKLGQLLKYLNLIASGAEAKEYLLLNEIFINGIKDSRRGKKIFNGDQILIQDTKYFIVEKKNECNKQK